MATKRMSTPHQMARGLNENHRPAANTHRLFRWLFVLFVLLAGGCVHRIYVNPIPTTPAAASIPKSLHIAVRSLALEGADHRPGIMFLEWSRHDLQQAIAQYAAQRKTFAALTDDRSDFTLHVRAKLALTSRQWHYHYQIRLQAEMREGDRVVKTYVADGLAKGSFARWVTASDRIPIESALRLALDDLFSRIEADRSVYTGEAGQPAS
ncbi:MAG: hypothetical protein NNA20_12645 [Nitrospira sp.]|nr:hypothetical protein [Nitrospira sp.]MCP9443423.1 hypothetical protein [Nitrospira sp.]